MPITQMYFNDGILFVKEEGRIEKQDARRFTEQIAHHAANCPTPVGAVIDAMDVRFISTKARKIFVRASTIPRFAFSAVAAENMVSVQTARVISTMSQDGHTYIFSNVEDAWDFALTRIKGART